MLSTRLTVALFIRNEEHRLASALECFRGLLPVVVIDNESIDRSAEIARALGCRVETIPNPGHIEDAVVMAQVQTVCPTDYLLIASCAEVVPLPLLERYAQIAEAGSYDVVRAPRISVTAGKEIPLSCSLKRRHPGELRMFRKGCVDYVGNQVHSVGRPTVSPERVLHLSQARENAFYQFRDYDCAVSERAHGRYNDLWARQRFAAGERFTLRRALWMTAGRFLRPYLLLGGWRHGVFGFIHCAYRGIMELTVQFRLWEHERGLTLERVRELNQEVRSHLVVELRRRGDISVERQ